MTHRRAGGEPAVDAELVESVEAGAELLREVCDQALEALGSTVPPTQLRALLIVDRFDRLNLNTLAQEMRASNSATSRLCDRLQASGLIVREAAARDRREVVISLSLPGRRLVGWARRQRRRELAKVIDTMSPAGREALVNGLSAFRAALDGHP
ncbi:MarR family winged helix-turn-helix transcriptional regulator [Thermomonospora umbrina]|uniref:DNA-binding MarR family transcriptional regulator n=1 Tax=Thermomonospora umbrina TaxID=111806 RepID=A0A3D9SGV9_9ACTN|nr:MarR family transcriptional regulator [Thermomonospora umbrina]REE95139.1 DNA-binding MarR family transcriptional regulator [Thermomonospora umbrina]